MKIQIFLIIFIILATRSLAQDSKTINVEAGGLSAALTAAEKSAVRNLTVTGSVDARDFKTMRDSMSILASVDLSGAVIHEFNGEGGTNSYMSFSNYAAHSVPNFAFNAKKSLESVILPSSVIAIEQNAFNGCTGLTDITSILSSVNVVGEYAFWGCTGITTLEFPSSVQSIGNSAFGLCTGLTSITIPKSVSSIGLGAFAEHKCPLTIDPENQYYSIVDGVLFNKAMTTLIECPVTMSGTYQIPSTVTTIAEYAFFNCHLVTSVVFPSSLESIGIQAFDLCRLKGQLILPSSLKSIGRSAFDNNTEISGELIIPSSVTSIGDQAFMNCSGLTSLIIPSSVKEIGNEAFWGCSGLTSITLTSSNPDNFIGTQTIFSQVDKSTCILHVPYGSKSAYSVSQFFKDFQKIVENSTGFFVNSSDVFLEKNEGSSAIISIKANVGWTFNCDQSWLKIEPSSGNGDAQITLTAIEQNDSRANRIDVVTVSSTGYESLVFSVTQKGSLGKIEVSAGKLYTMLSIAERSTLKSLTLSGTIDASDFVTLRDSMPMLEYLNLEDVSISAYSGINGPYWMNDYPADEIPFSAFYNTVSMRASLLKTIIFPNTLKTIGNGAFFKNSSLKTVQFSPSLTTINTSAFNGCTAIETLNLPSSIVSFGSGVFMLCAGLRSIQVNSSTPVPLDNAQNPFILIDLSLITLYVPSGSKSAYQSANIWKDFGAIIEGNMSVKSNELKNNAQVNLYPNPVADGFWINGVDGNANIRIADLSGNTLIEKEINANDFIPINTFTNGVYFVTISSNSGIVTKRILKE
jgi:hypothetical protein